MRSRVVWIGMAAITAGLLTGCGKSESTQAAGSTPMTAPMKSNEVQKIPAPPPKK